MQNFWGGNKEGYLKIFEKEIIPSFKNELEEYSSFRWNELSSNYKFKILRKLKF